MLISQKWGALCSTCSHACIKLCICYKISHYSWQGHSSVTPIHSLCNKYQGWPCMSRVNITKYQKILETTDHVICHEIDYEFSNKNLISESHLRLCLISPRKYLATCIHHEIFITCLVSTKRTRHAYIPSRQKKLMYV